MDPDEIMAEKIVAWWLFGHDKHYNDIAFLAGRMVQLGRRDHVPEVRTLVRRLIEKKLGATAKSARTSRAASRPSAPQSADVAWSSRKTTSTPTSARGSTAWRTSTGPGPIAQTSTGSCRESCCRCFSIEYLQAAGAATRRKCHQLMTHTLRGRKCSHYLHKSADASPADRRFWLARDRWRPAPTDTAAGGTKGGHVLYR